MLNLGIDSYSVIVRKLIFTLKERVFNSYKSIVTTIADAMLLDAPTCLKGG